MLGRNIHISNSDLKVVMEEILGSIYEVINTPLLLTNGNHDAIGTDFFKSDFWNRVVKNKFGNRDAVYDVAGSYYYVDYDKADTRLVFCQCLVNQFGSEKSDTHLGSWQRATRMVARNCIEYNEECYIDFACSLFLFL